MTRNHLADETSPYLRQHKEHPVYWYPWGPAAFAAARARDLPIMLSVGYSTCHWCHVMAQESFADPAVAELLNRTVISVKVDREERPDVDAVYMQAVQAMTGQGGWPMTVFLTPEGEPFHGGTYFPPAARYGLPAFAQLVTAIADAWRNRREELIAQGGRVIGALRRLPSPGDALPTEALELALEALESSYDTEYGGFGEAPKFPRPSTLDFLLQVGQQRGDPQLIEMVRHTLISLSAGGVFDQLGGGFSRYSTDPYWLVPHFEKMLYDNAQLASTYLRAWTVTGEQSLLAVAAETLQYVERDLTGRHGGFLSAEDADSEGAEGTFYLWDRSALHAVLDRRDAEVAAFRYGVDERGNFESTGKTVLHLARSLPEVAERFGITVAEAARRVSDIRRSLFLGRSERPKPHLDDKVVTAWNGLMISAMARGYQVIGDPRWLERATSAARFIEERLYHDGVLYRSFRGVASPYPGIIDDYAHLASGLIDLYESDFEARWLDLARSLMDAALYRFGDKEGGFFATADGQDPHLPVRLKDASDGAIPSGNGAAADALLRLWALTAEERYRDAVEGLLIAFAEPIRRAPLAYPSLLAILERFERGTTQIVIAGDAQGPQTRGLLEAAWRCRPAGSVMALATPDGECAASIGRGHVALNEQSSAWVCEGFTCRQPVQSPAALRALLLPLTGTHRSAR